MTISTATQDSIERSRTAASIDESDPDAVFETQLLLQPASGARRRWFDLCFRLIILTLAALWLLTPPAGNGRNAADEKAVATTQ